MPGLDDFRAFVTGEAASLISDMSKMDLATAEHNIAVLLGTSEDEPAPSPRPQQPKERTVAKLILGLSEILDSVQSLRNVSVYARRFPYANSGIEKGAYLRYHIENYLNELYILEKRMEAYLKAISRMYRHDPLGPTISRLADAILKSLSDALTDIREARGAHVHEERYSDQELNRLRVLETVKDQNARLSGLYEHFYRLTREAKLKWITEMNAGLQGLLDTYFAQLLEVLRSDDGHLHIPNGSVAASLDGTRKTTG
jgi:hypothetical protein